jgi:hypothetical protein
MSNEAKSFFDVGDEPLKAIEVDSSIIITPERPEEKPLPVEYKFSVAGDNCVDLELRAIGAAHLFFIDVEFSLRIEVHNSPQHDNCNDFVGHVTATKKVNWRYEDG